MTCDVYRTVRAGALIPDVGSKSSSRKELITSTKLAHVVSTARSWIAPRRLGGGVEFTEVRWWWPCQACQRRVEVGLVRFDALNGASWVEFWNHNSDVRVSLVGIRDWVKYKEKKAQVARTI
jgi:hypothetical protein